LLVVMIIPSLLIEFLLGGLLTLVAHNPDRDWPGYGRFLCGADGIVRAAARALRIRCR